MRLKKFVDNKNVSLVIMTSEAENDSGLFRTAEKFKDLCEKKNIKCYVVFSDKCFLSKDDNGILKIYKNDDKKGFEINKNNTIVLVRGGATLFKYGLDIISQLEKNDIFVVNNRETIETCSDKYKTILTLSDFGIICPKTSLISNIESANLAFNKMNKKLPLILKTITGSKGIGVFKVDTYEGLISSLQTIWKLNPNIEILMQEYIESPYDIRIHVLGGKIIASMKRNKIKDDFRSNFSLGGTTDTIKLTKEQEEIALNCSNIINATWCGIDMIENKKGNNFVLEINSSPGTEGIEKTTKINVIKQVLDYIIDKNNWKTKLKVCGYIEDIYIEEFKKTVKAKMDTGNGSFSSIHADSWEIKDDKVIWNFNKDIKIKSDLVRILKVEVGGHGRLVEERPVVKLNTVFDNIKYEINFALTDRNMKTSDVLINRYFLKRAGYVVDSSRKNLIV